MSAEFRKRLADREAAETQSEQPAVVTPEVVAPPEPVVPPAPVVTPAAKVETQLVAEWKELDADAALAVAMSADADTYAAFMEDLAKHQPDVHAQVVAAILGQSENKDATPAAGADITPAATEHADVAHHESVEAAKVPHKATRKKKQV